MLFCFGIDIHTYIHTTREIRKKLSNKIGKERKKKRERKNNMFDFRGTIDGNTIIQTRAGFKRSK